MGQKPRVCSSYFFEMEDGSRIEVRRELFLSWLQRGNYDGKYRKWGKRCRHRAGSRNQKEVNRVKGS